MSRIIKNPDVVSGAALIVVGAATLALSLDISRGPDTLNLPPNFVPLLCSGGIILAGLIVLARSLFSEARELPVVLNGRIAAVALALGLYYWFFEQIDFRLGSWVFVLATMFIMGCRSWKQLLITPIAVSGGIFLIFRYLFEILLPTWV